MSYVIVAFLVGLIIGWNFLSQPLAVKVVVEEMKKLVVKGIAKVKEWRSKRS